MADKGSNNWLWWSIGGIATLGLGLGIYYYIKSAKDAKNEEQKNNQGGGSLPTYTPPVTTTTNTTPSPAPAPAPTYTPKPTPFTSVEQSNAFRKWVNDKHNDFAREIDLDAFVTSASSINNATIQKAWGKYDIEYYTANANALGFIMKTLTGATDMEGGVVWKSVDGTPRGEIRMYTDGKITANAVNSQGAQTKFVQGGWWYGGLTFHIMIGGENYDVVNVLLNNVFWSVLKKAGIFNASTNSYSAFSGNVGATKFGRITEGTQLQDGLL
jgi:hypothetical protein